MDAKLYRASLLAGRGTLAVSADGDEGELKEARPTTLRVSSIAEGGRISTSDFFGDSLGECVRAAAAVLDFESLNLSEPSGRVTRSHVSVDVEDAAITFRAMMKGSELVLLSEEDEDEGEAIRLMSVDLPNGSREIFKGASLLECVAAARRHLVISAVKSKVRRARAVASDEEEDA